MLKFLFNMSFDAIPNESFCDIIILNRLVESEFIKPFEANLIRRTIVDVKNGRVSERLQYPENISSRALRVSFLFMKIYFVLQSCLASIGLKHFEVREIIRIIVEDS